MLTGFCVSIAAAQVREPAPIGEPNVIDQIQQTRAGISQDEVHQREALHHLFLINKKAREIAHKQESLAQKVFAQETRARELAQAVAELEDRTGQQKDTLNHRLRQLYQDRGQDDFHWLFKRAVSGRTRAQSPLSQTHD